MLNLLKLKCLFGFLWTSAIVAGLLSFIFFSFIDPLAIGAMMYHAGEAQTSSFWIYLGVFMFFWFSLNSATYLAFYFGQLLNEMEQEAEETEQRLDTPERMTGLPTS
ncbi:MAG: hypothetical protein P8163_12320 [Candidatus Thiodiazotropha sp.]